MRVSLCFTASAGAVLRPDFVRDTSLTGCRLASPEPLELPGQSKATPMISILNRKPQKGRSRSSRNSHRAALAMLRRGNGLASLVRAAKPRQRCPCATAWTMAHGCR